MTRKRTPIWHSIANTLTEDIAEGRYGPGDKLPTEAELSARFGVNRHTVRHALKSLAENRLVHARRGAGVYVAQVPTDYAIGKRVRFHRNITQAGRLPGKAVLHLETRSADEKECRALDLPPGSQVHVYDGLSLVDDNPIALFRSAFPSKRFPSLLQDLDRLRSVTEALKEHGVADYTRASTRMSAKRASATQALHLKIAEGDPILRTVAVNVDTTQTPVEFGTTWFAGDRVTLTMAE
ncbi:phosphonate metabolism transcriptional regulator PhnF [Shimia marina]|uniref:Putative transcriptional regulator PhnF n=1 Tax=Shimia marina TaxID=321267 RepID=A0A0P1EKI0_9RHOB|nr:phosphonate metabolism transcriptional regulator PhnF [Shimia marina]CUH50981.1 putative transcriptional regulator PhnF [Shimia marina]SFD61105.1 GntR family transcriptional regulator, phosphonate transport system regulatory protein [Shimia marina]